MDLDPGGPKNTDPAPDPDPQHWRTTKIVVFFFTSYSVICLDSNVTLLR
jgi:hypothetical protein